MENAARWQYSVKWLTQDHCQTGVLTTPSTWGILIPFSTAPCQLRVSTQQHCLGPNDTHCDMQIAWLKVERSLYGTAQQVSQLHQTPLEQKDTSNPSLLTKEVFQGLVDRKYIFFFLKFYLLEGLPKRKHLFHWNVLSQMPGKVNWE